MNNLLVDGYMQRQAPGLSEVSVRRLTHKNDVNENPVKAAYAVGGVQLIPDIKFISYSRHAYSYSGFVLVLGYATFRKSMALKLRINKMVSICAAKS